MESSTTLTNAGPPLVADASTVINLIATGSAGDIIACLPNRLAVVDVVPLELEAGRARGRQACDRLRALADEGVLDIVELDDRALMYFEGLVVGTAMDTLDDGEAATIAYAVANGATALIDERKATRICRERFPNLPLACTVDVLTHPCVQNRLGPAQLADAVFRALQEGRMGVSGDHLAWVVGVIGVDRAAQCTSLPRRARLLIPPSLAG